MQSIIDKLQTPQSFVQSVQELVIALQRTGDPGHLTALRPHLDHLAAIGTIHILRKHLYSTTINLTSKFFTKTRFFCQNKRISFSTLHFDEIFMLQFENFST